MKQSFVSGVVKTNAISIGVRASEIASAKEALGDDVGDAVIVSARSPAVLV